MREVVHVLLDELAKLEHDTGAALRVVCGPRGLGSLCGVNGLLEIGCSAETDVGLDLAQVRIEYVAATALCALAGSEVGTADEMIDAAKHWYASLGSEFLGSRCPRPGEAQMPVAQGV